MDASSNVALPNFPMYTIGKQDISVEMDGLISGELEGKQCLLFYHHKELAELALEQANALEGPKNDLVVIRSKQHLIDVLKNVPQAIEIIVWDKQLEAAGAFNVQIINCFLGGLLRPA